MRAREGPAGRRFAVRRAASASLFSGSFVPLAGGGCGGLAGNAGAGEVITRSRATLPDGRCTSSRGDFPSWTIPRRFGRAQPNPHQPRDIAHFPPGAQAPRSEKLVIGQA
jgi:hypothetical protein